ncbi:metallophosphoesterase [Falsibacillus albus]|uniref:Phosphoesterase n=1 Tax=Falsibacillus albus TaxID=2478915 RepID=A0A3L7K5A0_9BACI|nr:metallophosphoesterase [Falsibacillus albus]RLQ98020.1 metallophosphoesterase [Falsibacillus albus]
MKLLVVSDSHGSSGILEDLKRRYAQKVDGMFHCGDSELSPDDPAITGFKVVKGNCDYGPGFPEESLEVIDNEKIFVTHGHLFGIKMSLNKLFYHAKEQEADFVFFGHSHLVGAEMIENILFLNPGSTLLPRGRNEATYAIVEKENNRITVKIFEDTHEEMVDLRMEFTI